MSEPEELPAAPPTPARPENQTGVLVTCATIIILAALAAGGYLLWQELQRMANAKPAAPPEVTEALTELRTQLDRQRADSATQLRTLQQEIASLKEQQAAQPEPADIQETLAPVQQKLDAIAAQLQEQPAVAVAVPVAIEAGPEQAPVATPVTMPPGQNALHDYLALRRKVESGEPYAAELAALIPQLPDTQQNAIATLQAYAEHGLGESLSDEDSSSELKPWMHTVNEKLKGLVLIKSADEKPAASLEARAEVEDALDGIESSLMDAR